MSSPIPSTHSSPGIDHLRAIASEPRPAGSAAEARARYYAKDVLLTAAFDRFHYEPFEYSAFPGRWGTPVGGLLAALAVIVAGCVVLGTTARWTGIVALGATLGVVALFVRAMLGDAVLDLPHMRARSHNFAATRGGDSPRVWLVAHLDSKSQPVSSAARVAGVALLALAIATALAAALLQLAGQPYRMGWWVAIVLALLGLPIVVSSVVGTESDGAVDNASGVATVLLAASRVPRDLPLGVLLTSAEELGLAGARAWAREWARNAPDAIALNCDGVDDTGALTIMYTNRPDARLLDTLRAAAPSPLRVRRMPLGLLTDSVALAERGWRTVTVSRGGWTTLRRVHSRRDSLANLTGRGIDDAATLLARAAEALSR